MIIDGHSHSCGKYLTAEGIIKTLNENGVDKVVLVPGELNSKSEYSLPNIASKFPNYNVVKLTNNLTKFIIMQMLTNDWVQGKSEITALIQRNVDCG